MPRRTRSEANLRAPYPAARVSGHPANVADGGKRKLPDTKAIGEADIKAIRERVDCHFTGRTKTALVRGLENSSSDIKASAEQSAFTLTGVGSWKCRRPTSNLLPCNQLYAAVGTP